MDRDMFGYQPRFLAETKHPTFLWPVLPTYKARCLTRPSKYQPGVSRDFPQCKASVRCPARLQSHPANGRLRNGDLGWLHQCCESQAQVEDNSVRSHANRLQAMRHHSMCFRHHHFTHLTYCLDRVLRRLPMSEPGTRFGA